MSLLDWINNTIPFIHTNGPLIAFIVGILGGEESFITISFFAAQGLFSIWTVLIFCFLGNILGELLVFSLGQTKLVSSLKKWERTSGGYRKLHEILHKVGRGDRFSLLAITKFVYGTRMVTILYLSIEKMKFTKFLLYSILVDIPWIVLVVSLGWFAGKSFNTITTLFNDIKLAILFLVILAFAIYYAHKWITKSLLEKRSRKK